MEVEIGGVTRWASGVQTMCYFLICIVLSCTFMFCVLISVILQSLNV